jgi:catechol 2,3-dioxygenase-like lactoylglutathione lyase family enzyme
METAARASTISGGVATIFVRDMDRAVAFYTEALGLALKYRAGDHWAAIDAGGGFTLGLHPAGEGPPTPGVQGGVQVGFDVSGRMEDAIADLESRGVSFPGGIQEDGAVRLAFFGDTDGNEHYLCEHK